jgi:hypothetical protein
VSSIPVRKVIPSPGGGAQAAPSTKTLDIYHCATDDELHEMPHPFPAAAAAVLLVAGRWQS